MKAEACPSTIQHFCLDTPKMSLIEMKPVSSVSLEPFSLDSLRWWVKSQKPCHLTMTCNYTWRLRREGHLKSLNNSAFLPGHTQNESDWRRWNQFLAYHQSPFHSIPRWDDAWNRRGHVTSPQTMTWRLRATPSRSHPKWVWLRWNQFRAYHRSPFYSIPWDDEWNRRGHVYNSPQTMTWRLRRVPQRFSIFAWTHPKWVWLRWSQFLAYH